MPDVGCREVEDLRMALDLVIKKRDMSKNILYRDKISKNVPRA